MSDEPVLRIVRGAPTADELAVVTALVSAAGVDADPDACSAEAPLHGRWNDPSRRLRRTLSPGPGAWRAAGR